MIQQFENINLLPLAVIIFRLRQQDPFALAELYDTYQSDGATIIHLVNIVSSLSDTTVQGLLSTGLTQAEQSILDAFSLSASSFMSLPDWSTWTSQQANDYVTSSILQGWTQVQADSWVDTNVTSLAGARTAFKQVNTSLIAIRTILASLAKAVIFLRDFGVRLRR